MMIGVDILMCLKERGIGTGHWELTQVYMLKPNQLYIHIC